MDDPAAGLPGQADQQQTDQVKDLKGVKSNAPIFTVAAGLSLDWFVRRYYGRRLHSRFRQLGGRLP